MTNEAPVSVEYKVMVVRLETRMATNRQVYENTHKKDSNGDDIWEYIPAPDKLVTTNETVFEVRTPKVDLAKVFEAVCHD